MSRTKGRRGIKEEVVQQRCEGVSVLSASTGSVNSACLRPHHLNVYDRRPAYRFVDIKMSLHGEFGGEIRPDKTPLDISHR